MATKDGILTKEELNLILLVDNSYSMNGSRISQVNQAIPVLKDNLIEVADEHDVDLKVRIIAFSDEAIWQVGTVDKGEDIGSVVWKPLDVVGETTTATAIREANKALKKQYLGAHALRPVVVLITDGYCTDPHEEYLAAIEEMKKRLGGKSGKEKITRVAIGVEDFKRDELVEFASQGLYMDEMQPLVFSVDEPEKLGKVINWVTVTSILSSITDDGDTPPVLEPDEEEWV
ncbi:MAG: VWA domain-containing protein [Selenomonadaceae bacterium]|nr:VWA domain-containing protein [Selenomonadaceae bacterium]